MIKYAILGTIALVGLTYLKWLLTPPPDPIGTVIPSWDDYHRKRMMIRYADDQDYTQFN